MPTGETEKITNPNVSEKIRYIDKTYSDSLVHANCKDIYITDFSFRLKDEGMNFAEAWKRLRQGDKVKLPSWSGYWAWENETIMMYLRDGNVLDLRDTERPEYTFTNMASNEFLIANMENTPILNTEN